MSPLTGLLAVIAFHTGWLARVSFHTGWLTQIAPARSPKSLSTPAGAQL
jgi:hypothetical protein